MNLQLSRPQNNWKSWRYCKTSVKNSLMGPPKSTAPSLTPASSVNLTEILFAGENDLWDNARLAPSHRKSREMLNFDIQLSLISWANSPSISVMPLFWGLAGAGGWTSSMPSAPTSLSEKDASLVSLVHVPVWMLRSYSSYFNEIFSYPHAVSLSLKTGTRGVRESNVQCSKHCCLGVNDLF